jgi:type I restriction enzyme M protein
LAQDHAGDGEKYSLILANPPFAGSLDYEGTAKELLAIVKTNSGGTDNVWLYDMKAAGWSLDDKRQPLLPEDKIGLQPLRDGHSLLSETEHAKNNLPDVLPRWGQRHSSERQRSRTDQSFWVPKADIAGNDYDLSINRYKEVVHAASEHLPPQEILAKLAVLEAEIASGMKALEAMLSQEA